MRVSVKFQAFGNTLEDMTEDARKRWAEFVNNAEAKLPASSELSVETGTDKSGNTIYTATVYALTKVDTDEQ
jgi:hypothetical protein